MRVLRAQFTCDPQVIGLQNVVVVDEDQKIARGFGDAPQARRRQSQFVLAHNPRR